MPLFDRIFELIAGLGGLIVGLPQYQAIKLTLVLLGFIFSLALMLYWIYGEFKYKWGRWWWGLLFNIWAEARIKPSIFQSEWRKLQKIYGKDKMASVYKAEEIMQAVLDLYFFEQEPLRVRVEKISSITAQNIQRLQMAVDAIELIKARNNKNGKMEVSAQEIISILKEFEEALLNMLVLTEEDLWVRLLK